MGTSLHVTKCRVCMMSTFHFLRSSRTTWLTGVEQATEKKAAGARPPSVYWWMVLVIWTNGPRSSHLITKSHPTRRSLPAAFSPLLSFDIDKKTLAALSVYIHHGGGGGGVLPLCFIFANCGQTWRATRRQSSFVFFDFNSASGKHKTLSSIFITELSYFRCTFSLKSI